MKNTANISSPQMRYFSRFRLCRGFSMVEVVVAVTVIAAVAAIGFLAVSKYQKATEATKLESDVFALNQAAQLFRMSGGQLSGITDVQAVLERLKSVGGESAAAETTVGFRGLMIDRRITPVMMSSSEQSTTNLRAIWVPSEMRFAMVTAGPGVKEFALGSVTTAVESLRETGLQYAKASDWIWDYSEDGSTARPQYAGTVNEANNTPNAPTGGGTGNLQQLLPPVISLPGGFYDNSLFPLQISLSHDNGAGVSQILYSLDGVNWQVYTGTAVVVHSAAPNATLLAFCQSLDPDNYQDSTSADEAYETFTFSGSSSGEFSTPTAPDGVTPVYTIETTETGGSQFTWGTGANGSEPSSLTFDGADFDNIVPEQEFVVGTITFFNGTIYVGSEASGIELNIQLDVNVNIPVENEELSFPLDLINTPNYSWQDADENADFVKLSSTTSVFASAGDKQYYLILNFAEATASGYTTLDEFHVWEGSTAVGTLVAKVTTTPPGQEDTIQPEAILYTAESNVSGQFEVTATFDEYVQDFVAEDLVISNGQVSGFSGNGFNFTFFVTPEDDGDIAMFVPTGVATDGNGNGNIGSNTLIVTADLTPPVGIFSYGASGSADGSSSNPFRLNGPITVPLLFTETVTGLALEDIDVTNGALTALTGSGSSYTLSLAPDLDGMMVVTLVSGAVVDGVGHPSDASDPVYFEFDGTPPVLTLATTESIVSGSFEVTAIASEFVAGFTQSDITVSNGTVGSFSGSGMNYAFSVTPTAIGTVSVSVPSGTFTDDAGNLNAASNTVTVEFEQSDFINFNDYTINSFDFWQDNGSSSIHDGGNELRIKDNAWKSISFPYTVTANTVVEFEFKSTKQGEIHGIGFDTDNYISSNRTFRVYGTQNWGYGNYDNYGGSGWQSYSIPVGQFFTGSFTKLIFTADHDYAPGDKGNSRYRNLRVFDQ